MVPTASTSFPACDGPSYAGAFCVTFKVYSLFLLRAVLSSRFSLLQQVHIRPLERGSTVNALRTTSLVLAVSVPLLPVHAFFAVIVTTLAVLSGLVLAGAKRERPLPMPTAAAER